VRVRAYPISIDIPALEEIAHTDASDEHLHTLDQGLHGGQLLLRVDRPTPARTSSAASWPTTCSSRAPELHGEVQFLAPAAAQPAGRAGVRRLPRRDRRRAAAVNAKHGTGTWQPVDLRLASDMPLAAAAYRRCDVLVVNAVATG
jgi:trehalose-6-phosphate synthase